MPSPGFEKRASDRTLLVVEDDNDIRETLVSLLSMEGFRVTGCSNGHEALIWLRASPKPDLILLDLRMPIMDGWQFRVAQKGDPQLASIPAIALSADSTPKAAAIDAEAYLRKPVDYDTLLDTIDRLLVASEHRDLEVRLAQTDRLTSMGTLAAGVAHEINNPLAYVLLNLGYVTEEMQKLLAHCGAAAGESTTLGARVSEVMLALEHARDGAERIRDIVWSLKTFSRPESETCVFLNVTRVLDAALAMVQNEIRHRAKLVKNYSEVPEIFANEARLGQMFLNLVLNALQALPEDRALANEIHVTVKSSGSDRIVIEVRDNGVGIPLQVRGRIFEPFFSTKPVGVGTGLGLSICHGVVASLGGDLTFESEVGKGTVFRVELPAALRAIVATPAAPRPERRVSEAAPPASFVRRSRMLVVDDEPIVCFSLERLLAREGDVLTATSAGQALAMIQAGQRFDVFLCDLMLPEMDGPALHENIRKIDPAQAERMVFMTGGVFTVRARDFLETVKNKRLSKPFDVDALLSLVRGKLSDAAT